MQQHSRESSDMLAGTLAFAPDRPAPTVTAATGPDDVTDPPDAHVPDRDGLAHAHGAEPALLQRAFGAFQIL